ncbi:hypothetical protein [Tunturiibacter lichenicola]|uniref:hypothetical protein n=1 Tax=Tunturiibacter lichenicola TaxID=2051959 RepID=UPI003D9BF1F9
MWLASEFHPEPEELPKFYPEGLLYALHYDRGAFTWNLLRHHPVWAADFAIFAEDRLLHQPFSHALNPFKGLPAREEHAGFWQNPFAPETKCIRTPADYIHHRFTKQQNDAEIAKFRQHYSVEGTHVLVDVSAWADCAFDKQQVSDYADGAADNQVEILPIGDFNDSDYHTDAVGSAHVSERAADQILALMKQDGSSPSTAGTSTR